MKLGVITDGISRDLEYALKVMNETGLEYAELQFVWDKEIGDQTPEEIQKIKELITKYNVKVPIITRHNFVGMLVIMLIPWRWCAGDLLTPTNSPGVLFGMVGAGTFISSALLATRRVFWSGWLPWPISNAWIWGLRWRILS